ncbi:hypothetical protein [Streptomyces platensis]|uniref:hypothetical protein n=1 Tax=Streptomyces platensis TaxID=58346 RepID=UPI00379FD622
MNSLSIDTMSVSFALGEVLGVLLVVGGVMTLIWRLSGPWRRVSVPPRPLPAVQLAQLRAKRRNIVRGVLALIALGGVAMAASSYNPEPRAADTDSARSHKKPSDPPAGTGHTPPKRTIVAPKTVEGYRLMSDQEAVSHATPAGDPPTRYKRWYYDSSPDGESDGEPDGVLLIDTVEWDPGLAAEKRRESLTQELRNFFAEAKAREVTAFPAGPMGGRLSCGYMPTEHGEVTVCAWSDATTFGFLPLADVARLDDAAPIALAFRTAAERRS